MSWYDIPTCKVSGSWCDECIMIYFKTSSFSKLARVLQSNWPQSNPHLYLDMIYPSAKFDVDWSKETQVILKKLMFDARPTTDILILITRFHPVKTWLMNAMIKFTYLTSSVKRMQQVWETADKAYIHFITTASCKSGVGKDHIPETGRIIVIPVAIWLTVMQLKCDTHTYRFAWSSVPAYSKTTANLFKLLHITLDYNIWNKNLHKYQVIIQKSTQVSGYNNLPKSPNYPWLNFLTACNTYLNTYLALLEKEAWKSKSWGEKTLNPKVHIINPPTLREVQTFTQKNSLWYLTCKRKNNKIYAKYHWNMTFLSNTWIHWHIVVVIFKYNIDNNSNN